MGQRGSEGEGQSTCGRALTSEASSQRESGAYGLRPSSCVGGLSRRAGRSEAAAGPLSESHRAGQASGEPAGPRGRKEQADVGKEAGLVRLG